MNDSLNTDKIIKEKLEGFSVAPPTHVWENVKGQMAMRRRKKRVAYISWGTAAALVALAFVAGWMLNESASSFPELAEQKPVQDSVREIGIEDNTEVSEVVNDEDLIADAKEAKKDVTLANNTIKASAQNTIDVSELAMDHTVIVRVENARYSLMNSIEAVFRKNEGKPGLAEHKTKQETLTEADKVLIAENLKNNYAHEPEENNWKIGTLIAPGYASSSASHSQQYAQNLNYSSDAGSTNVGAGLSVQYKTSKRLSVESGLYYSQNEQSSGGSGGNSFLMENASDYLLSGNYGANKYGFSNNVAIGSEGMAMNSLAGVVNMNSTPKGAMVATSPEDTNIGNDGREAFANTFASSGEFSQVFQFVEIPLYLRYNILDKRFGMELLGGFNAAIVVGNNAFIDNQYGKQNIGKTEDISTANISGTLGLGMNYILGKHFSLALEPRFNYYLNSISNNDDVDFRPYRIGLYTGVYYQF